MAERWCRVKNWDQFQHYSQRNPPWIKLHVRLLNDRDFLALTPTCKALLMMCWILASEEGGKIDTDLDELRFRLRWPTLAQKTIDKLIGDRWLIDDASDVLADDNGSLSVSDSVSTKKEKKPGPESVEIPSALAAESSFASSWSEWLEYRREKGKPVSVRAARAQLKKLAKDPSVAVEAIENSIANDWQGLFPEKLSRSSSSRRAPKGVGSNPDAKPLEERDVEIT